MISHSKKIRHIKCKDYEPSHITHTKIMTEQISNCSKCLEVFYSPRLNLVCDKCKQKTRN